VPVGQKSSMGNTISRAAVSGEGETRDGTQNDGRTNDHDDNTSNTYSRRVGLNTQSFRAAGQRASIIYDNLRRHRSADLMTARQSSGLVIPTSNEIDFEQENRPLVQMDVDMQEAPADGVTSRFSPRRRSTMSRLGTRLLPDSVARGLLNSGEETAAEGRALRLGSTDHMRHSTYQPTMHARSQLLTRRSIAGSLRRPNQTLRDIRHESLRGPSPFEHNSNHLPETDSTRSESPDGSRDVPAASMREIRHRNRFSRVRDSLSLPSRISGLFGRSSDQLRPNSPTPDLTSRSGRLPFGEDSHRLLPSAQGTEQRHDADDAPHELDAVEPEARTLLPGPRVTSGMSTIRRFQPGLRSRSTRLIRRGEHPPLSQVLQLAAAAIAAQLSGHGGIGQPGSRQVGGETFDGSIQNFVQTLQDAATAQAGETIDMNSSDGDLPPVNFMRVFQFPNDENGSPIASQAQARDVDQMDLDAIAGPGEAERSVTLVLVGVRSLPHGHDSNNGENGTTGPSLDTLLSLPFLPPANVLRNGSSGALFRRSDGRTPSTNARRHSMTNFSFPAQYETQRHQRTRTAAGRTSTNTDTTLPMTSDAIAGQQLASDSPAGPHPPPSTPADLRSGQTSPVRRPSSASAVQTPALPDLDEDRPQLGPHNSNYETSYTLPRQRRRSDTEFARRPELGSGAARRNGMVEPDHPPPGIGRSWLIYVVGTNVSPDHPAFTMPSLFTDNPSYEDMQMLSTLLGPVKPPVATQEDVTSAGGLFRLSLQGTELLAESIIDGGSESFAINVGERCLICLSDYVATEQVRRLDKCHHLYHHECIDEVSGINSMIRFLTDTSF
jgi:hypothetical protein